MARTGMSPEQLREKALAVAEDRIRRHGFEKVRLVDIAKDLGITHVALYGHFADKAAILDSISERWLLAIDAKLETICAKPKNPLDKIHEYFQTLHLAKLEKVLEDPELYKSFDAAVEYGKPFVAHHLKTMVDQVTRLCKEAVQTKAIRKQPPDKIATLLLEATISFTHPKMVAYFRHEKREALLKQLLATLLAGLA